MFSRDVRSAADGAAADPTENDAPLVDDEAGVPAALVKLLADVLQAVAETADRYVSAHISARACLASLCSFERESYLTGWVSIAEQARRAAGCLDFAISADLLDPGPHQQLRALGVASGPRDLPRQRP